MFLYSTGSAFAVRGTRQGRSTGSVRDRRKRRSLIILTLKGTGVKHDLRQAVIHSGSTAPPPPCIPLPRHLPRFSCIGFRRERGKRYYGEGGKRRFPLLLEDTSPSPPLRCEKRSRLPDRNSVV